jgi:hypothetical protein
VTKAAVGTDRSRGTAPILDSTIVTPRGHIWSNLTELETVGLLPYIVVALGERPWVN